MIRGEYEALVLIRKEDELTLDALASSAEVDPGWVEDIVDLGLIVPARRAAGQMFFHVSAAVRLRKIVRLQRHLGVNLAGVEIILELSERLESLQRELNELRRRFE